MSKLVLFVLVCVCVCVCVCVVCELLLMYDDKDLGSFKAAAMALYFWFFNITLSGEEEKRGSKMSWLGWDQKERQSMHLVLLEAL